MVANFHTHTTFCDGKNTPEEIVLAALDKGFSAIGFSGHAFTAFDQRYCMQDTEGYIAEVRRVQEKYAREIEVYLGIEEDAFAPVRRDRFDYLIGSSHYFCVSGRYYPIDSDYEYFKGCLDAFDGDILRLAETYFSVFLDYIKRRRPDIVGHFDVITKFDEVDVARFSCNDAYLALAERYAAEVAKSGCIVEVNTGPMWRGYRQTPLPNENVLRILHKQGAEVMIASDSHSVDTLDYRLGDIKAYLRDVGFRHVMTMRGGRFVRESLYE